MIHRAADGSIDFVEIKGTKFLFNGLGPKLSEVETAGVTAGLKLTEEEDCLLIQIQIENQNAEAVKINRLSLYLGVDCYMDRFPDWNEKLFPTLLRFEKTHFWGYFMSPEGKICGIASPEPFASYRLLYNDCGHRIYSVQLDIFNTAKQPERYPQALYKIEAGEVLTRNVYLYPVSELESVETEAAKYTRAPVTKIEKFTVERGEQIIPLADNDTKLQILSPSGKMLGSKVKAEEYGIYRIISQKNGKISEACVYCRKDWSFYLKEARRQAVLAPQKATTHTESWYGLFSGYLAAKHYPDEKLDQQIEEKFSEIMPYMFDMEAGKPIVIPERIQNVSGMISLLADRFEANPAKNEDSLWLADKLSDFLIERQKEDGAYYSHGTAHYTCVIYLAKSMMELYLAEKELPQLVRQAEKHFSSAKKAVDNLVKLLDNIGTEGEHTFEDGMISCSALQIAMFALLLNEEARQPYIDAAEYMLKKHACLEQKMIPDCRMRGGSLRYWESQYDVLTKPNMMNSPHGWTAWTLYAKYYLYLLTGKTEYLTELMDGIGSCAQLMELDGRLRWAFICDPCIDADLFVKDKKLKNGYSGTYVKGYIGEQYLDMISYWFTHEEQRVTGGYLECPLFLEDETLEVDTQGGCCDNDVHEIFKCMEETVLKKAFLHETENGDLLCYSCSTDGSTLTTADKAEILCYRVKKQWELCIDGKQVILFPTEHPVLSKL